MNPTPLVRARLVALLFLGMLLLNFPIFSLASRELFIGGIPLLFAYGFAVWALLILLIALVVESKTRDSMTLRDSPGRQADTSSDAEGKTS